MCRNPANKFLTSLIYTELPLRISSDGERFFASPKTSIKANIATRENMKCDCGDSQPEILLDKLPNDVVIPISKITDST